MSNASPSAANGAPGQGLTRWQTSLFPSNLGLITHVAKRMDSWAAAFVFQMALGVMGAELPALGHSRMERQDVCVWAPEINLTLVHTFHFRAPSWKCWMLSLAA